MRSQRHDWATELNWTPGKIQVAREKHFFPKGALPDKPIPPLVRPPLAARPRRRSAEAHAQVASSALRFSHGGGQSGRSQQGSGNVWSGADFGGVAAAAEPGRWEDEIRRRAAPGAFGQGLPSVILPLRKPKFKEGWEPLNIETSLSIASGYLGPGTVLSAVGTCFHPSSLQLFQDCNHSLRESLRASSEVPASWERRVWCGHWTFVQSAKESRERKQWRLRCVLGRGFRDLQSVVGIYSHS